MSASSSSAGGPGGELPTGSAGSRPSIYREVAGILCLLALAVVLGVVDLLLQGQVPSLSSAISAWNWVFVLVIVILVIVVLLWTLRLVFRGLGIDRREEHRERRLRRYGMEPSGGRPDSAVEIARERYARGEITQDQLDQMLRQLGKSG